MAIIPFEVATDGYLSGSTLGIATDGYLGVDIEVEEPQAPVTKPGGSGKVKKRPIKEVIPEEELEDWRRRVDEEEILLITQIFVKTCL